MTIDLRKMPKTKPATWDDLLAGWGATDARRSVRAYDPDEPRDWKGRWTEGGGGSVLEGTNYEGKTGDNTHITRVETGTIPTSAIAQLKGASGEQPGEHTTRNDERYQALKDDVAANGMKTPIFITVDYDQDPVISEGNNRRDVAVDLGMRNVPVEIRYYGHAETQGTVLERRPGVTYGHPGFGPDESEGEVGRSLRYSEDQPRDYHGRWTAGGGDDESQPLTATDPKLPPGWEKKGLGQGYLVNASTKTIIRDLSGKPIPQFVVDSVADLQTRFPVDVAGVEVNIDYSMSDDIGGATTSPWIGQVLDPDGHYTIRLNGNLMNGGTDNLGNDLTERWRAAAADGRLMSSGADDPARYCIYHEYGHVLDNSTGQREALARGTNAEAELSSLLNSASQASDGDRLHSIVEGMSKYAQYLPGEGMAEGFADYAITNGKTTNPYSLQVIKALQTAGAIK